MASQSQIPVVKDQDDNLIPVSRPFAASIAAIFGPKTSRNLRAQSKYSRQTISGYVWPEEAK